MADKSIMISDDKGILHSFRLSEITEASWMSFSDEPDICYLNMYRLQMPLKEARGAVAKFADGSGLILDFEQASRPGGMNWAETQAELAQEDAYFQSGGWDPLDLPKDDGEGGSKVLQYAFK